MHEASHRRSPPRPRAGIAGAVRAAVLACLAGWLPAVATADIYAFVDETGVTHFSNVPLDRRYRVFLRSELPAVGNRARRGATAAPRFRQQVRLASEAHQVAPALIHAVISAESGYDPRARSRKGAMGLMQLMPATAERYCVDDPYDPEQNIRGGVSYLRDLMHRFDSNLALVLAAYNAGEAAVERHGNRIPPYAETRQYVPRVLDLYERYRDDAALHMPATAAPLPASPPCRGNASATLASLGDGR